jgi:hypothetical protein
MAVCEADLAIPKIAQIPEAQLTCDVQSMP